MNLGLVKSNINFPTLNYNQQSEYVYWSRGVLSSLPAAARTTTVSTVSTIATSRYLEKVSIILWDKKPDNLFAGFAMNINKRQAIPGSCHNLRNGQGEAYRPMHDIHLNIDSHAQQAYCLCLDTLAHQKH
jgi:hypothetical protein